MFLSVCRSWFEHNHVYGASTPTWLKNAANYRHWFISYLIPIHAESVAITLEEKIKKRRQKRRRKIQSNWCRGAENRRWNFKIFMMFRLPLSFLCDKNTLNEYYNTTTTTVAEEMERNMSRSTANKKLNTSTINLFGNSSVSLCRRLSVK